MKKLTSSRSMTLHETTKQQSFLLGVLPFEYSCVIHECARVIQRYSGVKYHFEKRISKRKGIILNNPSTFSVSFRTVVLKCVFTLKIERTAHTFARAISSSANLHRERPLNRVSSARTYSFFVSYFLFNFFRVAFLTINSKGVSYFIKKELPQLNFALIFSYFVLCENTEGISKHAD